MKSTWSAPVRFAETDAQGVVFNAHYLTWCDEAASALLAARGLASFAEDIRLVASSIAWSGPARWGDVVDVTATCAKVGNTSFVLDFDVAVSGTTICRVTTTYVHVGADGRPAPVTDAERDALLDAPTAG